MITTTPLRAGSIAKPRSPSIRLRFKRPCTVSPVAPSRLRDTPPDLPDVNPSIAEVYRRKIDRLADALADSRARPEAATAIRSLIGDVVPMPGERRGEVNATLLGELLAILNIASVGKAQRTDVPAV